jgi:adenylate cyclase
MTTEGPAQGCAPPDGAAAARLAVNVLGASLVSTHAGREVPLYGRRKAQALLGYLAMSGRAEDGRERIAALLWGEAEDDGRARGSLRKAVHELREALAAAGAPPDLLRGGRSALGLAPGSFSLDAEEAVRRAEAGIVDAALLDAPRADEAALAGLEDLDPGFRAWLLGWRRAYRSRLVRALEGILRRNPPGGGTAEALRAAEALLNLDPTHEEACRYAMRARAGAGDTAGALRAYEALWQALGQEHDAEPSDPTQRLVADIKTGRLGGVSDAPPRGGRPAPLGGFSGAEACAPGSGVGSAQGRLALPDLPSLVVLPFQNMDGDPAQEYFADGMVEEITTALSRIRRLFVIARNSAFAYKGRAMDVRQVGCELGVRYALEGSVRRAGGRIRITAQLLEAAAGAHVWAERFDGDIAEVFELQDRVAEAVAAAIEPSLRLAEVERARRKPTGSLGAYDLYLRAFPHHYAKTKADSDAALDLLRRAVALDPAFVQAKAFTAYSIMIREVQGWLGPGERAEGARLAREALSNGRDDPATLRCAGQAIAWLGHDRERGLAAVERALLLNSNSAQTHGAAAWMLLYVGRPERAIGLFRRAIRLSPLDPELSYFLSGLGYAYLMARRFDEALEAGLRAVAEMPDRGTGHRVVVAALHALGRTEEATAAAGRYREANPAGARVFADRVAAKFIDRAFVATMVEGLRAAGLPE